MVVSANAADTDKNWYVGASYGATKTDMGVSSTTGTASLDKKDKGYKVYAGYKYNKYISTEVFYTDLGKANLSGNNGDQFTAKGTLYEFTANNAKVESDTQSFGIAALVTYPLHKYIEPFAKLGIQRWNYELNASSSTTASENLKDDGVDIMYGAGINFPITNYLTIRTEYEVYDIDGTDIDFLSAG